MTFTYNPQPHNQASPPSVSAETPATTHNPGLQPSTAINVSEGSTSITSPPPSTSAPAPDNLPQGCDGELQEVRSRLGKESRKREEVEIQYKELLSQYSDQEEVARKIAEVHDKRVHDTQRFAQRMNELATYFDHLGYSSSAKVMSQLSTTLSK